MKIVTEHLCDGEGGCYGYFAKGTYLAQDFASAVNADWDEEVSERDVKHVLWRAVPVRHGEADYQFIEAKQRGRGVFEATYVEI